MLTLVQAFSRFFDRQSAFLVQTCVEFRVNKTSVTFKDPTC